MTLQRIEFGKGHWYKLDGVKADGVTTLIKDGLPKPALTYWSAKCVAEFVADKPDEVETLRGIGRDAMVNALKGVPWGQRDAAAVRGTEVHALGERLVKGEEVEVPEHLAGHVEAYIKFLDRWQVKPILVEASVGHRKWKYAGTLDLVAEIDGYPGRTLLDIKTAASGIWPETAYQLAAYRHAEIYLDADGNEQPMADLDIRQSFAIWARADAADLVPVATGDSVFKDFLHIAWVARKAKGNKSLIGDIVHD